MPIKNDLVTLASLKKAAKQRDREKIFWEKFTEEHTTMPTPKKPRKI